MHLMNTRRSRPAIRLGLSGDTSDRLEYLIVAVVVLCGVIHLPTIGIGELGNPDPKFQAMLILPSLFAALRVVTAPSWRVLLDPVIVTLLLSIAWMGASSLLGPEPIDGLARSAWFGASAIALVGSVHRIGPELAITTASLATALFIAAGLALHLTGLVDGAWGVELASEPLFPWTRLNALGANQTVLGLTGALTALSVIVTHRRLGLLGSFAICAIGLAGTLASHNRSAIAAALVGLIAAAFWARQRWSLVVAGGVTAAMGASLLSSRVTRRFNRDALASDDSFDFYNGAERGVLTGRGEVWRNAWDFAMQRPLIGHGSGAYAQYTDARFLNGIERWDPNHPHNVALELFVDQGVIGVLLALAVVVAIVRAHGRWQPWTVALFVALVTHGVVEAMFYGSPSPRWTLFVIAATSLASTDIGGGRQPPGADRSGHEQAEGIGEQRLVYTAQQPGERHHDE